MVAGRDPGAIAADVAAQGALGARIDGQKLRGPLLDESDSAEVATVQTPVLMDHDSV